MGVRLVKFDRYGNTNNYSYDHNDLVNRDMMNQHPIYAIVGLQEVLNILEDSITDINQYLIDHTTDAIEKNIDDIEESIQDLYNEIRTHIIQNVEDTYSVDMSYDKDTQTLKSDVKIFKDDTYDNAIQLLATGLYVPPIDTMDTKSVIWSKLVSGYTLKSIFDTGIKISHSISSWDTCYNPNDVNAWTYNTSKKSFIQPNNTDTMSGFVTNEKFDYYSHTVRLESTDVDDDIIGIIIGYVIDDATGRPHTLSVVCNKQSTANSYAIWYDYSLPDAVRIMNIGNVSFGTRPGGQITGAWSTCGGILIEIYKEHDIVEVTASDWGEEILNENTKMRLDLKKYSWGKQFIDAVQYGYFSHSQPNSYFRLDNFEARNTPTRNTFKADVNVSKNNQNEIQVYADGIFAPKFNISAQSGNGLVKKTDGYYVCAAISKDAGNALEAHTDGLYTRDYRNIRIVTKNNHGFIVGDFIYYHPTSGYLKAKGIDYYDINIVGMVTKVIDVNRFEYQWSGFFPTDLFTVSKGYTQGMPLYISETTAGKVTQKQPDISKAVGYPVENAGLIISVERGVQYNQEAKIGDFKYSANDYNVRSDGFIKIALDVDYKKSLIERLLNALSDDFKALYLIEKDTTIQWTNIDELYNVQKVPYGMNLFIKAF